jgi:hypothetical protein
MKLEALQEFNAEVTALGARIVVLTPELEGTRAFLRGSFIPYNMPVYPGALRVADLHNDGLVSRPASIVLN